MRGSFNGWLFAIGMVAMVIVFVVVNVNIISETEMLEQECVSVNRSIMDLKAENQALTKELDTVGTDAFIERQARDNYDYMMPDELRFVISFPDEEADQPSL